MLKNSEKSPAREDASKKLSANLMRIRTKILKTVQDETLDDALSFLKERYNVEKDVNIRLATMAAQSWIIRQKFVRIGLDEPSSVKDHMGEFLPKNKLAAMKPKAKSEEPVKLTAQDGPTGWQLVKIIKETEVNGMQFFENTTINVSDADAEKLISANKAEKVEAEAPRPRRRTGQKSEGIIMKASTIAGLLALGVIAGVGITSLGSLKRFEHRTMSCSNPMIGPFELVVNRAKVGQTAQLTQPQGSFTLIITAISNGVIIADHDQRRLRFSIDFANEKVLVQENSKLKSSKCKTTEFSM